MKILLTGAAGYIGSELTKWLLLDSKNRVIAVDNLFYKDNIHVPMYFSQFSEYEFHKIDVRDKHKMEPLVDEADIIIHLAALVGFPTCDRYHTLAYDIHVTATQDLVQRAKGKPFIYLNTNSGYGITDGNSLCTEETPLRPISRYGQTKCWGENSIRTMSDNYVVLRLATVFGPSMRLRRDLLVNNFVWRAYKDGVNVIFDADAKRNYLHIRDLMLGICRIIRIWDSVKNEVYNFGNDSINMSKLELAQTIQRVLPHRIMQAEIGSDPDKRNYIVTSEKLARKGIKAEVGITEAIDPLVKIYKIIDEPVYGNY